MTNAPTPEPRNLMIAVALSVVILMGFHYFYERPAMQSASPQTQTRTQNQATARPEPVSAPTVAPQSRDQILAQTDDLRVPITSSAVQGSLNLRGGRLDDLQLPQYRETVDPTSPAITLLSPAGSAAPHQPWYAEFGWLSANPDVVVPSPTTVWQADTPHLTPDTPVVLTWNNGRGLIFERRISLDSQFMFTISDRVRNTSGQAVTLWPYGLVARHGLPKTEGTYILHEGPIGVLGGTLHDPTYKNLLKKQRLTYETTGGWMGFTDKYWLVSLVPDRAAPLQAAFTFKGAPLQGGATNAEDGLFQADVRGTAITVESGAAAETTMRLFAGAKNLSILDRYARQFDIPLFDRAIDFGWYYFLTKPLLMMLDWLGDLLGNFGWAIVVLTLVLRGATMPLSLKSYRSMARMKVIQPEMKRLQELYKDDRARLGTEIMALYKREKVNPASGCLPNLLQIPIFFALYKVLYVGLELRHAPLFGWIKDLSAPDPTSILTLFGLLDWSFIPHIGVWPILMGLSMFLQQRLSPQPADKTQAQIFIWLPVIFTFMLANVAVGLIVYWTLSNILGIMQQTYITRKSA